MRYELKIYHESEPDNTRTLVTENYLSLIKFIEETPGLLVAQQLDKLRKTGL